MELAAMGSMLGYQTLWQSIASQKTDAKSRMLVAEIQAYDGTTFGQRPHGRRI
jgi:hypothetical protein